MNLHQIFQTELKNKEFISKLVKSDGNTIVYNLNLLRKMVNYYYKIAEENGYRLFYSVKANYNKEILQTIKRGGIIEADCSSIYEYEEAKKAGFKNIRLTSIGITEDFIKKIDFNIASVDCSNLIQLKQISKIYPHKSLGIRIMCDSDLGVDLECLQKEKDLLSRIERVHFHGDSIQSIKRELIKLSILINVKQIKRVNLGGGQLATLLLSNASEAKELVSFIKSICSNACIEVEPGQLIVAPSGFLISKVISKSKDYVVLNNSAFNLSSWYIPFLINPKSKEGNGKILGNTNWQEDIFVKNVDISSFKLNDKLIFGFLGAYFKTTSRYLHGYKFPREIYYGL